MNAHAYMVAVLVLFIRQRSFPYWPGLFVLIIIIILIIISLERPRFS